MSMLVNEYINIQNELKELNNHINKFNYNSYFKQEFNRIIECSINNFNLKDVFKVLLYTFDYDFYILLTRNENYKKSCSTKLIAPLLLSIYFLYI